MTTSLYGTSTTAGEVASTNFTTLYSNTTQSVPVQVSGNTTYEIASQATTGGANLLLTGSDGSTDTVKYESGVGIAVSSTDGSTILITNTSPAGTTYNIDATAAIGGANLNLYGSDSTLDSVKFAGGTNVTVTRTDASTITISSAADDIPDGTVQGQVLYWDGTDWVAENRLEYDNLAGRLTFTNNIINGVSAIALAKKYSGTLLDGTQVGQLMGATDGSTNIWTNRITSEYDTGANPIFRVQADPVGNFGPGSTTIYTTLYLDNTYLGVNGTQLVLLANETGAPTQNATIRVNRGTDTDATITWDETTDNRWESNFDFLATGLQGGNVQIAMGGGSDNEIYIGGNDLLINTDGSHVIQSNSPIQTTAQSMSINSDSTAADSYLYMKGNTEYLKWEDASGVAANSRFELSDQLYITLDDIPAKFERQVLTADINTATESKSALRLVERVTDAPNNDTTVTGPGITFSRTSGATATTEQIFGQIGTSWDGTNDKVWMFFNGSTDNFDEPTPGVFPGSFSMLVLKTDEAYFKYNSIYVDYATSGSPQIGINTGTPNYTLDVNGDANVSGDIYVSGVHVDLSTPVHQGQLLYVSNDVTPTITNSSLIQFTSTTYRPRFEADTGVSGRTQGGAVVSNNTGAVNYTTGDGASLLMGVDSDAQSASIFGSISSAYNTSGDHQIRLSSSNNNFNSEQATSITGGNTLVFPTAHGFTIGDKLYFASPTQNGLTYQEVYYVISTGFTTTQCQVSATLGGSAVSLTNGTGLNLWFYDDVKRLITATTQSTEILAPTLLFNATNTGIPGVNAGLEVERGTSGANSSFIWSETNDRWEASEDFFVQKATIGFIDIDRTDGQIDTNSGVNLTLDSDGGTVLINDNLNVDSGVLYVDAGSNEVGINTTTPTNALSVVGNADVSGFVAADEIRVDGVSTYNTQTTNTSSTSVVSISSTTRASQKSVIRIIDNVTGDIQMLEALAFYKGTTAYLTTYAEMYTGAAALATFTADVSAGLIRILATPASTNSTTFTVARISLD